MAIAASVMALNSSSHAAYEITSVPSGRVRALIETTSVKMATAACRPPRRQEADGLSGGRVTSGAIVRSEGRVARKSAMDRPWRSLFRPRTAAASHLADDPLDMGVPPRSPSLGHGGVTQITRGLSVD